MVHSSGHSSHNGCQMLSSFTFRYVRAHPAWICSMFVEYTLYSHLLWRWTFSKNPQGLSVVFGLVFARPSPNKPICLLAVCSFVVKWRQNFELNYNWVWSERYVWSTIYPQLYLITRPLNQLLTYSRSQLYLNTIEFDTTTVRSLNWATSLSRLWT